MVKVKVFYAHSLNGLSIKSTKMDFMYDLKRNVMDWQAQCLNLEVMEGLIYSDLV